MNGKTSYRQKNIVYAEKKILKHHAQEFIVTVKIREFTNVRAAV